MIDLHCHLLPGIDDGARDLDDALAMARIAVTRGTTHIVVTPHIHPGRWENSTATISAACQKLQSALDEQAIPLQLSYACEVRLSEALQGQIKRDEIPFLGSYGGDKVMLLEFPHSHVVPGSERLVAWLRRQGIRPMIAHPERNREIMVNLNALRPFVELGCLVQVTAGAVVGRFGGPAARAAHALLETGVVTVIASDGHNQGPRKPVMDHARDWIAHNLGAAKAITLCLESPGRIAEEHWRRSGTHSP